MELKDNKVKMDINVDKMQYQEVLKGFLGIVEEASNLTIEKINKYGDSRYKIKSFDYDSKMIYSDIFRKFIRIENITWNFDELLKADNNKKELLEDLRETYLDSLNYNAIAIQIIDKYLAKEKGGQNE